MLRPCEVLREEDGRGPGRILGKCSETRMERDVRRWPSAFLEGTLSTCVHGATTSESLDHSNHFEFTNLPVRQS